MANIKISNIVDGILSKHPNPQREDLGTLLLEAQLEFGYLSEDVIKRISDFVGVSATEAYGYASFYSMYKLKKPGLHTIKICKGTACHVKGSKRLIDEICSYLNVAPGETTEDSLFTVELSSCLGVCALAPIVMIDEITYSRVKFATIRKVIDEIRYQNSSDVRND